MSALHPAGDDPMRHDDAGGATDLSDGIEVVDDHAVVDLDTVRRRPRTARAHTGARRRRSHPIDLDIDVDPVDPARPVFEGAAAFRPVVIAIAAAVAMFIVYGVVAVTLLLVPNGAAATRSSTVVASPAREIIGSVGSVASPARCEVVSGRLFIDSDANSVANPWDPAFDFGGRQVEVRSVDGFRRVLTTDTDGVWSTALPAANVSMVAVDGLDALAVEGLWPGPRQLSHAGEFAAIGETCTSDIGLVWIPPATRPPALADLGAPPPVPGAGGAVQVHGRLWTDLDGDRRFDVDEPLRSGVGLELRDVEGAVVSRATSGGDGLYAFANLAPSTRYVLALADGETAGAARFLGEPVDDPTQPIVFDTGAANLTVWGADFALVDPTAPVAGDLAVDRDSPRVDRRSGT